MAEWDELEGKAKQAGGRLADDESLEREGEVQEAWGETKDKVGDAWDEATDAVDDAADEVKERF